MAQLDRAPFSGAEARRITVGAPTSHPLLRKLSQSYDSALLRLLIAFLSLAMRSVSADSSQADRDYCCQGHVFGVRLARAAANRIARKVKLADLEDNMDVRRIDDLADRDLERIRKYHRAWRILTNMPP